MTYAKPLGAYYVFPRYNKDIDSLSLTQDLITSAGVAVIPGYVFGASGEKHIRISFAVDDDVLRQGITKLQSYFNT